MASTAGPELRLQAAGPTLTPSQPAAEQAHPTLHQSLRSSAARLALATTRPSSAVSWATTCATPWPLPRGTPSSTHTSTSWPGARNLRWRRAGGAGVRRQGEGGASRDAACLLASCT